MVSQPPLLEQIKNGAAWHGRNEFGCHEAWNVEHEKWLTFIKKEGRWEQYLPKLRGLPKQRDDAFAEIATAYFLCKFKSFRIIEWDPKGHNNHKGEYVLSTPVGRVFL